MESRKLVDMTPATVAPVTNLKARYHQKEGARAEHMPLSAVTAAAIPTARLLPAGH